MEIERFPNRFLDIRDSSKRDRPQVGLSKSTWEDF